VGRHPVRRRSGRVEGHRLRDALRRGVGALRRVRPVRHRAGARAGGSAAPRRARQLNPAGEDDALTALRDASAAIVDGVERTLPAWVARSIESILDAWGKADDETRAQALEFAAIAGHTASARVADDLRALFALDPAQQATTPLEIVRTAVREPTDVLRAAGVPAVVRDAFAERAWPEDRYGLVPSTLGDLGDPELGPLQLAWGLAKAKVLRARAEPGRS
jgi:hypothetical protein